jgi:hypothetical protein
MIDGFSGCTSLSRVDIPASVENILSSDFKQCTGLTEVVFAADSRLRTIYGFRVCKSVYRMEIRASVETILAPAFEDCRALTEVTFPPDSRLRSFDTFHECDSLYQLKIPASVEITRFPDTYNIYGWWIVRSQQSRELIFASGTRIKELPPFGDFREFIDFADRDDLKKRRRRVHLITSRPLAKERP